MESRIAPILITLGALAFVACNGKDDDTTDEYPTDEGDADTDADTDIDTDTDTDTDTDLPIDEVAEVVALSAAGADALYAVAATDDGGFVAAGFAAATTDADADREMVAVKLTAEGDLDTTFGTDGVARVNVAVGGTTGELARGVVVQSTGKIVIGGSIEHDVTAVGTAASDRDLALVRLEADGSLDTTFGDAGIVVLDLGTGAEVSDGAGGFTWAGADAFWSLGLAANDGLVIHGATKAADAQRTDTDFALVRLTADGVLDATFGDGGVFTLDLEQANASARNAIVLADGSIIAGGYANTPSIGTTQPVLYKVTPAGVLDTSFADAGVFHDEVLAAAAEIYGVAQIGTGFVTAGYGHASDFDSLDWLSLHFDADGVRDLAWGGTGALQVDVSGFADRARNIYALPDGSALVIGGASLSDDVFDGAYGILSPDGTVASPGPVLHDFGGTADMMWGAAIAPDERSALVVGVKGAGSTQDATNNDDAAIWLLPLD